MQVGERPNSLSELARVPSTRSHDQVCLLLLAGTETEALPYFSVRVGGAAEETLHPDLQETSGSRLQGLSGEGTSPRKDKEEGETSLRNIAVCWPCAAAWKPRRESHIRHCIVVQIG